MTQLDSAMFVILIVLVVAFLAIALVAIHWITTNSQHIEENSKKIDKANLTDKFQEKKIQNNTNINKRQDVNLRYLNGTIKQGR